MLLELNSDLLNEVEKGDDLYLKGKTLVSVPADVGHETLYFQVD